MTKVRAQKGFTLIEIMIALTIVSVAVLAISSALSEHTKMASGLEKRLLAGWVASNKIAVIRHQAKIEKVKTGNRSDTVEMGGQRWRTRSKVVKTDVERVFLVTVVVRDDARPKDPPYATLTSAVSDSF